MATPGQSVFRRYILFRLASLIDWRVVSTKNLRQEEIDNLRGNARRVTHDYAIGDRVYVEITDIYRKHNDEKQGP